MQTFLGKVIGRENVNCLPCLKKIILILLIVLDFVHVRSCPLNQTIILAIFRKCVYITQSHSELLNYKREGEKKGGGGGGGGGG